MRGLAAWWVVLYHVHETLPEGMPAPLLRLLASGYLAVDLFFVLSGFVIALAHAGEFRRPGWPATRRFLGLRLARIYPLHAVMLAAFLLNPLAIVLFSAHAAPGPAYAPGYFVQSVFLVQNWGFSGETAWNVPAWSISTEWFAYLLFPGLAWGLARLGGSWRTLAAAGALLLALDLAAGRAGGLGARIEQFGLLRCVLEFAVGLCAFRLWRLGAGPRRRAWAELCLALCLALVAATLALGLPGEALLPAAFALLVLALAERRSLASRLLSWRPLERLGAYSYATYLCHYFVRDWVRFLLLPGFHPAPGRAWLALLAYGVGTAALSVPLHRLVERPGRRIGRRWATRSAGKVEAPGG